MDVQLSPSASEPASPPSPCPSCGNAAVQRVADSYQASQKASPPVTPALSGISPDGSIFAAPSHPEPSEPDTPPVPAALSRFLAPPRERTSFLFQQSGAIAAAGLLAVVLFLVRLSFIQRERGQPIEGTPLGMTVITLFALSVLLTIIGFYQWQVDLNKIERERPAVEAKRARWNLLGFCPQCERVHEPLTQRHVPAAEIQALLS